MIYLSSLLNIGVTPQWAAGVLWLAGRVAEVKSNDVIEISNPNNPKINTYNDISVISFEFSFDGRWRVTLSRQT